MVNYYNILKEVLSEICFHLLSHQGSLTFFLSFLSIFHLMCDV